MCVNERLKQHCIVQLPFINIQNIKSQSHCDIMFCKNTFLCKQHWGCTVSLVVYHLNFMQSDSNRKQISEAPAFTFFPFFLASWYICGKDISSSFLCRSNTKSSASIFRLSPTLPPSQWDSAPLTTFLLAFDPAGHILPVPDLQSHSSLGKALADWFTRNKEH